MANPRALVEREAIGCGGAGEGCSCLYSQNVWLQFLYDQFWCKH